VLAGRVGVVNQSRGAFPEPRFLILRLVSSSSGLFEAAMLACFFSSALSVVSFRALPFSSSSESDESDPERLSSRSCGY